MIPTTPRTVLFAVALAATIVVAAAVPAMAESSATTLRGAYVWDEIGDGGDLEAVFTPAGEGVWDVEFFFTFRGTPHTYAGQARGSLTEGDLAGTVKNEDRRRTFEFRGAFDNGTFRGTHEETTEGRERKTGTLTLAPSGS
jgi:hypothetical protein